MSFFSISNLVNGMREQQQQQQQQQQPQQQDSERKGRSATSIPSIPSFRPTQFNTTNFPSIIGQMTMTNNWIVKGSLQTNDDWWFV